NTALVDFRRRSLQGLTSLHEGDRRAVIPRDIPLARDRHAARPELRVERQRAIGEGAARGYAADIEPLRIERPLRSDTADHGLQKADVWALVILPLVACGASSPALVPWLPVPAIRSRPVALAAANIGILFGALADGADDHEALIRHQRVGARTRHGEIGVRGFHRSGQWNPYRLGTADALGGINHEGAHQAVARETGVEAFLHLEPLRALPFDVGGRSLLLRREAGAERKHRDQIQRSVAHVCLPRFGEGYDGSGDE